MPLPAIIRTGTATAVEARVNLRGGLGIGETLQLITECGQHPGKVTIQRLEPPVKWTLADANNPMGLMPVDMIEGSRVLLTVEDTDATAEHLAKRLYGILTTRYGYQISMGDADDSY